jgi:hypothetical protein
MTAASAVVRAIVDPRARTVARFMEKVQKRWTGQQKRSRTRCWLWTAAKDKDGYGMFQYAGPTGDQKRAKRRATRVAYELFVGALTHDTVLRHRCDTPACVNPAHLIPGTTADNVADRVRRGRSAVGDRSGAHRHPDIWQRIAKAKSRHFYFGGKSMTLSEISVATGISRVLLVSRIDRGWNIGRAVSTPVGNNGRKKKECP